MLKEEKIQQIREELDNCKNPLFFFDDDPDGLSSFLLLYRYKKEGHGVVIKSVPKLTDMFLAKVHEYDPDKIFILDIAMVDQDFIDKAKRPIVWVDHHEPQKRHGVKYFNPRMDDKHDNTPTSNICYNVVKQDIWIAMAGNIGDWHTPEFRGEFCDKYPDLLDSKVKSPEEALFNSSIGKLVRVFSFILKGRTSDVNKCFRVMTRIDTPYEILNQTTPQGKFIYKTYESVNREYEKLLQDVLKHVTKDKLLLYTYKIAAISFTSDISNELLYRYPKKFIIIAREKSGEMRMSIRNKGKKEIPPMLAKALQGLEGYGGGHEHACGANVKVEQFDTFIERFRSLI